MTLHADTSLRQFPLAGWADLANAADAGANRVADLTHRPRIGLRGSGTPGWCEGNGLPFPDRINGVATIDRYRIARLGHFELLVTSKTDAPLPEAFHTLPDGTYWGYREDGWAWFRVSGPGTMCAISSLTSANLRSVEASGDRVVQTRLAGLDAVLVIGGATGTSAVDLFADIASSSYLMDVFGDRCPDFRICAAA